MVFFLHKRNYVNLPFFRVDSIGTCFIHIHPATLYSYFISDREGQDRPKTIPNKQRARLPPAEREEREREGERKFWTATNTKPRNLLLSFFLPSPKRGCQRLHLSIKSGRQGTGRAVSPVNQLHAQCTKGRSAC